MTPIRASFTIKGKETQATAEAGDINIHTIVESDDPRKSPTVLDLEGKEEGGSAFYTKKGEGDRSEFNSISVGAGETKTITVVNGTKVKLQGR